jgi:hypothetical protein
MSLSEHFRQLQAKEERKQADIGCRWETDSGLGDSPPPTPGYVHSSELADFYLKNTRPCTEEKCSIQENFYESTGEIT